MTITKLLLDRGLFSKDIKQRFASSQIKVNDEPITKDIELDATEFMDIGEFVVHLIEQNFYGHLYFFGLENVMEVSDLNTKYIKYLSQFIIVRYSKKDAIVLKKKSI